MTTDNENTQGSLSEILETDTKENHQSCKKFRFISGDYVGASLCLCSGVHLLGNTNNCEVFCGLGTSQTEIRLDIDDDGTVKASVILGAADVGGKVISVGSEIIMSESMVLKIGTDALVWITDESNFLENWKFVSSVQLDELKNQIKEQLSVSQENETKVSNKTEEHEAPTEEQSNNSKNEELLQGQTTENLSVDINKASLTKKIVAIVGVIILCILLVAMNCGPWLEERETQDPEIDLKNYVTSFKPGRLQYETEGHTPVVSGYLPNEAALEKFKNGLPTNFDGPIELKITMTTELFKYLKDAFSSHGITVTPRMRQGYFYVSGYIHDTVAEAESITKVMNDFNKYGPIISEMKNATEMEQEILRLQKNENLYFPVKFGRAMIGYEGDFSLQEQQKIEAIKLGLEKFANAEIDFRAFTEFTSLEKDYLSSLQKEDLETEPNVSKFSKDDKDKKVIAVDSKEFSVKSIAGINIGPVSFITLKNGHKYFAGGKLPNGAILRKIANDSLTVEIDGKETVINIE